MSKDESPGDAALSRAYREGSKAEPPPALDALILAAARKEAAMRVPAAPTPPWWRRWLAPVGALATLVLTLSIVLTVEREHGDLLPTPAPAAAPKPAEPTPSTPSAAAADVAAQAATPAAPSEEVRRRAVAKPAAPPPAERQPALSPQTSDNGGAGSPLHPGKAEVAPEPRSAMESEASGAIAQPRARESIMPAPEAADSAGEGVLREKRSASQAAPAASPPAAARSASRLGGSFNEFAHVRPATEWIEDIRRLRRAGREAEAQVQLTAFRRAYPDYPLPDDLK